jgi:hypothetical protein
VQRVAGFAGLRVLHAGLVAAILAVAWRALRRASGSVAFASLGAAAFASLSAYRVFQLRPELVTILATALLLGGLVRGPAAASRARLAAFALGFALWANAHGGFVLGLALLGVAALAAAASALRADAAPEARDRARDLAALCAAAWLGSLANPSGLHAHALYFTAGRSTPELAMIVDEWAPLRLFALPLANRPPSFASWAITWALWLLAPLAVGLHARAWRTSRASDPPDPALLAAAAAGLAAPLTAVRLAWLGIAPLLVIARAWRALGGPARRLAAWACALATAAVAVAFARVGDWPAISSGIDAAVYTRPYPPEKYYAHPVWFLRDAGVEGRVWNDYLSGNFLAYWLAPALRAFVNGSLNVPPDAIADGTAIRARTPRFTEILDRRAIDVFFAIGTPVIPRANHPARYTTAHLEDTPGWLTVFRNVDSAIYLRTNERNRANLERIAAHYAREGVPFDAARGFDALAVIRASPTWAASHGILPADWRALQAAARSDRFEESSPARARIATVYALDGLYEQAAAIDRELLAAAPRSVRAARRLTWSLLHLHRPEETREAARQLAALAPERGTLAYSVALAARTMPDLDPDAARALLARLPLFTESESRATLAAFAAPEARIQ